MLDFTSITERTATYTTYCGNSAVKEAAAAIVRLAIDVMMKAEGGALYAGGVIDAAAYVNVACVSPLNCVRGPLRDVTELVHAQLRTIMFDMTDETSLFDVYRRVYEVESMTPGDTLHVADVAIADFTAEATELTQQAYKYDDAVYSGEERSAADRLRRISSLVTEVSACYYEALNAAIAAVYYDGRHAAIVKRTAMVYACVMSTVSELVTPLRSATQAEAEAADYTAYHAMKAVHCVNALM